MSEDAPPKRYQVCAAYVQVRVPNSGAGYYGRTPWMHRGFNQNAILPPETHPDDIAHLLATTAPGKLGGPMIEELPEVVKETSR